PGDQITATVTRLSRSLDPRTRTMLTEIDVPNEPLRIYPGEFVHVGLKIRGRALPLVPVEALIGEGEDVHVATIDPETHRAHLVKVALGHDDGKVVEVISGLK